MTEKELEALIARKAEQFRDKEAFEGTWPPSEITKKSYKQGFRDAIEIGKAMGQIEAFTRTENFACNSCKATLLKEAESELKRLVGGGG